MQILKSALKHGYSPDELENVVNSCPKRIKFKSRFGVCFVYWGPDRNGNIIEVFMSEDDKVIFHAMKLSRTMSKLIDKGA